MKKILTLLMIGILVLTGISTVALTDKQLKTQKTQEITLNVSFSENLILYDEDNYLRLVLDGAETELMDPGKPMLPMCIKTFMFSRAARIKEVNCQHSQVKKQAIYGKVMPTPKPIPYSIANSVEKADLLIEDQTVYSSKEQYPDAWYDYKIRCGMNYEGVLTTFVIIELYPIRYAPTTNIVYFVSDFDIHILYDDPGVTSSSTGGESYDLVIIAPDEFSESLQPLIIHKNNYGVSTLLKTTEEIYAEYEGRDKPEQIKYFIKDAKESWNITYVLLVGGLKSYIYANDKDDCNQGSTAWHLPVRYANIQGDTSEKNYISDQYYGDLYRYNETLEQWEFEDWDSSGDGIFAKWTMTIGDRDELDLLPDIYVGRLACRNTQKVTTLVNKIITYESTSPEEKPWFKKMITIAGRTFGFKEGQPDGEFDCDTAISYMGDLIQPLRIYASNEDTGGLLPIREDVIPAISEGAGYVLFQGHGNPVRWNTYQLDSNEWFSSYGISNLYVSLLSNGEKLPVVVVGGCHNGLFNITIIKALLYGGEGQYWTHNFPTPVCFSWLFCTLPSGGAIASTGCTGLGLKDRSDKMEVDFFYLIGQGGATTPGSAHSGSIQKYISEKYITRTDAYCITEFQFFGDPSLKLGGYS